MRKEECGVRNEEWGVRNEEWGMRNGSEECGILLNETKITTGGSNDLN